MKKIINKLIISAILVGIFSLGVFVGLFKAKNSIDLNDTYDSGWQAAINRIHDITSFNVLGDEKLPVYTIGGLIEEVGGDYLNIKIQPLTLLADPALDDRIVKINLDTKIIESEKKDPEDYRKEMDQFEKESFEGWTEEDFLKKTPRMFIEKKSSINNLKIGYSITVKSKNNIRDEKEIIAEKIVFKQ